MDKRRDPTIARPKERRKRGDMSHDHVRCYNVRPWSHHVLWSCEWRQYCALYESITVVTPSTTTYYSVLQSTTPVLPQYYSVLQSTTPVLLCTTKYYASTTSVLCQYYNVLPRYYFETSCTMRGATRGTVQLHQILRLPRKMNVINDLRHIWNLISNARSK